ncbi:MAG: hypothetical protein PSV13_10000 [Lacunisphaera sp.]|nr:hypothetical protein [Lacunisphaera sp.]
MTSLSRREFLALTSTALACLPRLSAAPAGAPASADAEFYRDWLGTTLVEGQYHLTDRPNLLEGAEQMLALGTRVGKFWFEPHRAARDYPWHSRWPEMKTLRDLADSPYWREVFALPFHTLFLETHSPAESGWNADHGVDYYARIEAEWEELVRFLYAEHGHKPLTIVLQNWEGDWQLRGIGVLWDSPPADWRQRCGRYARRLAARQAAVTRVRAGHPSARLRVLHAAEVNRVADQWRGIPTLTEHVLPQVELDRVSYSCYDAMEDGAMLTRAIDTIRRFARTTGPLGAGAVCLGEIGIPEMAKPTRIAERWAELLAAARAAQVQWVVQWALYCNESDNRSERQPKPPVTDPHRLQGFWLYRPDGSLSETGRVFRALWRGEP